VEKISWRDHVRNVGVFHRVKQGRGMSYIIITITILLLITIIIIGGGRNAALMGVILYRNCLLRHFIGGKTDRRIEVREEEEEDVSSYQIALRK
jgi:hypothetical protein